MLIEVFDKVRQVVESSPHSSQSLLLFGLIKTLEIEKGGHMYLLVKLKEMSEDTRQLAYQLMEMMASDQLVGEAWQNFVASIEDSIRNA